VDIWQTFGISFWYFGIGANVGGSYVHQAHRILEENNWIRSNTRSRSKSKTDAESKGRLDAFAVSNGKSNAKTDSHTSSSTTENHASDSIS
jgi:hypothetical protein